jgi:HEAT repeat protein
MVDDPDWDVVIATAEALAMLRDTSAVPALEKVLASTNVSEVKHRVAVALGDLGSAAGIPALFDGLEEHDQLLRESYFEDVFALTGLHFAYDPSGTLEDRLVAISKLRARWAAQGGSESLRPRRRIDPRVREHALHLVIQLGGGSDTEAGGDDTAIVSELVHLAEDAEPALIEALTFPSGFSKKRELACEAIARIGGQDMTPFLAIALNDPVLSVSEAACNALEVAQDPEVLPAVKRYEARLRAVAAESGNPDCMDVPLAQAARVELRLGNDKARDTLVALLSSRDDGAREAAITALEKQYGDRRGYDATASADKRTEAIRRWMQ